MTLKDKFDHFRLMLSGQTDIPIDYIYYLMALNVFTMFIFVFVVYRVFRTINESNVDEKLTDEEVSDDASEAATGGEYTLSSSSEESIAKPAPLSPQRNVFRRRARKDSGSQVISTA